MNTNGAEKNADVEIAVDNFSSDMFEFETKGNDYKEKILNLMSDLNVCSYKRVLLRDLTALLEETRVYAVWRKVSAYAAAEYGCKDSSAGK